LKVSKVAEEECLKRPNVLGSDARKIDGRL
jgi:hypothetical protein